MFVCGHWTSLTCFRQISNKHEPTVSRLKLNITASAYFTPQSPQAWIILHSHTLVDIRGNCIHTVQYLNGWTRFKCYILSCINMVIPTRSVTLAINSTICRSQIRIKYECIEQILNSLVQPFILPASPTFFLSYVDYHNVIVMKANWWWATCTRQCGEVCFCVIAQVRTLGKWDSGVNLYCSWDHRHIIRPRFPPTHKIQHLQRQRKKPFILYTWYNAQSTLHPDLNWT